MFIRPQRPHLIRQHRQITWMARQLRRHSTKAEQYLWQFLKNKQLKGYKFRRQFVIYNCIADFYCHELKLVIEVDGDVHLDRKNHDAVRDEMLREHGYIVLRFTNEEVFKNITSVLQSISHSF